MANKREIKDQVRKVSSSTTKKSLQEDSNPNTSRSKKKYQPTNGGEEEQDILCILEERHYSGYPLQSYNPYDLAQGPDEDEDEDDDEDDDEDFEDGDDEDEDEDEDEDYGDEEEENEDERDEKLSKYILKQGRDSSLIVQKYLKSSRINEKVSPQEAKQKTGFRKSATEKKGKLETQKNPSSYKRN